MIWTITPGAETKVSNRNGLCVALIEKMFGRMVDVQQDGVKLSPRCIYIKTGAGKLEKIALPQLASGIRGKHLAIRDESGLMPIDYCLKKIDDEQPAPLVVFSKPRRLYNPTLNRRSPCPTHLQAAQARALRAAARLR